MEERFAFDQIANVYKVARPDYPEALIQDVVSYANLKQGDPILEVCCGTGQATKSFAKRGFPIVAMDPGPEMLRVARDDLAGFGNVEFVETTFEAWPANRGAFRLIVAAQSWHWVSPEMRFAKAAEALSPNGSLAVFGHVPVGLRAEFGQARRPLYWVDDLERVWRVCERLPGDTEHRPYGRPPHQVLTKKSTTAFGSSASSATISGFVDLREKAFNPPTTRLAQGSNGFELRSSKLPHKADTGCHLC
jgi:SAM-dependent methyltransferase